MMDTMKKIEGMSRLSQQAESDAKREDFLLPDEIFQETIMMIIMSYNDEEKIENQNENTITTCKEVHLKI